ncbi:MAG TPA: M20/M25/M40 family metallo-hydrolase, partial [Thermoleophilia bacterium]|nr:M20/M25/M40 family metallo-hydrolase [Thermoleophilia bacterium]
AGVVDAQWESLGASALLDRYRPDAAVLAERTDLDVVIEHGGFTRFEIESRGIQDVGLKAGSYDAAGPDAVEGIDVIALLGPVLDGVRRLDRALAQKSPASFGRPSLRASSISSGTRDPGLPASCVLQVERRLVPGESVSDAENELRSIIDTAGQADPRLRCSLRTLAGRDPVRLEHDAPVVAALIGAAGTELSRLVPVRGDRDWMDSGVLIEGGVPCVIFGPTGGREHTADEWIDLKSVETSARVYVRLAERFCA